MRLPPLSCLNESFTGGARKTAKMGLLNPALATEALRNLFAQEPPDGYVTMKEAMLRLGVSRQTVMQRVKNGKLEAVHVQKGRSKGLWIKVLDPQPALFDALS